MAFSSKASTDGSGSAPLELHRVFGKEVYAGHEVEKLGMVLSGLPPGYVEIASVAEGSWAEDAGILPGDILVETNGEDLQTMSGERLKGQLRRRPFHAVLEQLDEERDNVRHTQRLRRGTGLPAEPMRYLEVAAHEGVERLGVTPHGLPPGHLQVTAVTPGSWAESVGVKVGYTIIEVNGLDLVDVQAVAFKQHLQQRPLKLLLVHPEPSVPKACIQVDGSGTQSEASNQQQQRESTLPVRRSWRRHSSLTLHSEFGRELSMPPIHRRSAGRTEGHPTALETPSSRSAYVMESQEVRLQRELEATVQILSSPRTTEVHSTVPTPQSPASSGREELPALTPAQSRWAGRKTEVRPTASGQQQQQQAANTDGWQSQAIRLQRDANGTEDAEVHSLRLQVKQKHEECVHLQSELAESLSSSEHAINATAETLEVERLRAMLRVEQAMQRSICLHQGTRVSNGPAGQRDDPSISQETEEVHRLRALLRAEEGALRSLRRDEARRRAEHDELQVPTALTQGIRQQLEAQALETGARACTRGFAGNERESVLGYTATSPSAGATLASEVGAQGIDVWREPPSPQRAVDDVAQQLQQDLEQRAEKMKGFIHVLQDSTIGPLEEALAQRDEEAERANNLHAAFSQQQVMLQSELRELEASRSTAVLLHSELRELEASRSTLQTRGDSAVADLTSLMQVASMHGNLVAELNLARSSTNGLEEQLEAAQAAEAAVSVMTAEEIANLQKEVMQLQGKLNAVGQPSSGVLELLMDPRDRLAEEEVSEANEARAVRLALARRESMCASLLVSNRTMEASVLQLEAENEKHAHDIERLMLQQSGMFEAAGTMRLERDRAAEAARAEHTLKEMETNMVSAMQEALTASFKELQDAGNQLDVAEAMTKYEVFEAKELGALAISERALMAQELADISKSFQRERIGIETKLAEVTEERDWCAREVLESRQELQGEQAAVQHLHRVKEWEAQSASQVKMAASRQKDSFRELQDNNLHMRQLLRTANDENEELCVAFARKLAFLEETASSWCTRAQRQQDVASSVASKVLGLEAGAEESALLWQKAEKATEESETLQQRLHKQRQLSDTALKLEERMARDAAEVAAQAQQVEAEVVGRALVEVREQAYQKVTAMRRADDAVYSVRESQRQMELQARSVRALRTTTEVRNWDATSLETLLDGARAVLEGAPEGDPATLDALLLQASISASPRQKQAELNRPLREGIGRLSPGGAPEVTLLRAQAEQLHSQLQQWNVTREPLAPGLGNVKRDAQSRLDIGKS